MIRHTANIQTAQASNYVQRLCEHYSGKVPVNHNAAQGEIKLPMGLCILSADPQSLHIHTIADTQREARQLVQTITSRLELVAFRESPKIEWTEADNTDPDNSNP